MWWLWRTDGYSYSLRRAGVHDLGGLALVLGSPPALYRSAFAVEIPFRIISGLGFYTIFRWLVSFNRLAVGRGMRMIELKRQVNELSERLVDAPPYNLDFADKKPDAENQEAT